MRSDSGQQRLTAAEHETARGAPSPVHIVLVVGLAAAVASVVALLVAGGRPQPAPPGLPDAGALTAWGLPLARVLGDVVAVLTVGSLVLAALLVPAEPDGRRSLHPVASGAVHVAGRFAAAWALTAGALLLLRVSDTTAVPLADLTPDVVTPMVTTRQGLALVAVVASATVVAVAARYAGTLLRARLLLLVALVGLLPPAVTGHVSSASDPEVATAGIVVHVVAAALWVGGLAGVLVHLTRDTTVAVQAVRRFSVLALTAFLALAGSGLLTAATRLGTSLAQWTSGYGGLVIAKVALLVVLGIVGGLHRKRTLPRLAAGRPGSFLRLAGVELVVMGAATGLAAALVRTPVPTQPVSIESPASHGLGHETLPASVDAFSIGALATAWRPNAVVLVVLGGALAVYVAGVRQLARSGATWPRYRGASFGTGLLLALIALCSGAATYAPAMVSVQVAQLLVVLLPVPVLLLFGAPLTLWRRVRALDDGQGGRRDTAVLDSPAARLLADPVTGAVVVSGLLLAVYWTPLIEVSLRSAWVHLLVVALALGSGLVLLGPVLAVDPVVERRGITERALAVLAVAGCLALLGARLRYGDQLLAGAWFLELRWGWADPVQDQRLAGLVAGAAAAGLLALLGVVVARGRRSAGEAHGFGGRP
jgi:cytochrome c oxidase assembly factor CtaG/putative copper export protein